MADFMKCVVSLFLTSIMMNPKILEQEANMNRFKYETYLKFYFKTHKKNESKRIASGYTKGVMLLQKTNYGALLSYQRVTIKDILRQRILNTQLLKRIYRERIEVRKWVEFRPLKILKEKEATNAKSL